MKQNLEYVVNYQGLKTGKHIYAFQLGDRFFEDTEGQEFVNASIHVNVEVLKENTMMVFEFSHEGQMTVTCDRCLDEFVIAVKGYNKLIANFGEEDDLEDETIIVLSRTGFEFDLAPFIREYILLSLPLRRICKDSMTEKHCNKEMIEKLKALKSEETEEADPRWAALKNIKLD